MKRLLAALLALGVVAGGIGYKILILDHDTPGPLVLQGNVDIRQANLAFKVAGRIRAMMVQEGDRVTAGQTLAELERIDFEAELAQARGVVTTQAATLAELVNGSRPQEIEQARATVADDEAALVDARLVFDRQHELLKSGNTPKQSLDTAQATWLQAQARLASAKAGLALAVQGPRQERIDAARGQLEQAKASLALANQRLADTVLVAPEDGVILSRVHEPGTIVTTGDVVYTIVLSHPTWVRAYVAEPSLEQVRPGMVAEIVTDGGRRYQGRIGYVSPLAEFTPKTVQTPEQRADLVYRLRLVVEDADDGLRQGMPVTVHLPEDRRR
jgi:HlyD family secretion protein